MRKLKSKQALITIKALFIGLSLLLVSCVGGGGEEAAPAVSNAFNPDLYVNSDTPAPGCFIDNYSTPDEAITRKIDILIVPDTSGSIIDERAAIADGFDSFINILPTGVDFRIAVMLGHAHTAHSGSLYQKGSEAIILDSELQTIAEIKADLRTKMQNPATENATDGGEVGLMSLMNGLNNNLDTMKAQGFFRDDAALAVIFVADENDICAEFPAGVVPVPDPQGGETNTYNNDCLDGSGNNKYLPATVVAKLKEVKAGYPLVVGGVIYNNANTIPLVSENEIGYGYLETINAAGGITVDMANGDYGNGLQNLGMMATSSMAPENEFNLSVTNVDTSTITVQVNGANAPFFYVPELNQVHLEQPRSPLSAVTVQYCEKPEVAAETIQIVAGGFHSCALLSTGDVKCWGLNIFGQLGVGNTNNIGDDESPSASVVVDLGAKAKQISAGYLHTCALLVDGNVRCWGYNIQGQLGYGHTDNIGDDEAPSTAGNVSLGGEVARIFSGTSYNCAVMKSGSVRCWGQNDLGQLGLGHTNNIGDDEIPSSVAAIPLGSSVVQMDLSSISNHSCAILANGSLKCWGRNNYGQLGYGHTNNLGDDESVSGIGNVNVGGSVTTITTGNFHTCALLNTGSVKCWGANTNGELGYAMATASVTAPLVGSLDLGDSAVAISAGSSHTCAVLASDNVVCWGLNNEGQLGLGHTTNIGDDETPATGGFVSLGFQADQIGLGASHACVLEKDTGKSQCWGSNNYGQLGQGNTSAIGDNEAVSSVGFVAF